MKASTSGNGEALAESPRRRRVGLRARQALLSLGFLVVMLGLTILAYEVVYFQEGLTLRSHTQADAVVLAQRMQGRIEEQFRPLRRLRDAWLAGTIETPLEFTSAADPLIADWPAGEFLAGLDAEGICRWAVPYPGFEHLLDKDMDQDRQWGPVIRQAVNDESELSMQWIGASEEDRRLAVAAVLSHDPQGERTSPSTIIARLDMGRVLGASVDEHLRRDFNIHLSDEQHRIVRIGNDAGAGSEYAEHRLVSVGDRVWRLSMMPSDDFMRTRLLRPTQWILWGGVPTALLLSLALWQVLDNRARQVRQAEAHLRALRSLNEISAAISAKLGAGTEVLDRLAELARRLLKMDRAGIAILDESGERMTMLASSGDVAEEARREFVLSEMPVSRRCIQEGQILFDEDARRGIGPNWEVLGEYDAVALILIPLHVESKCIGLMALADSRRGRFSDADRRLAGLLGSQASVILSNNRLYEQTRRDAQTKAVLLRELHHRVKNNLAGIVGLLSFGTPEFSSDARHWLERVVERIRAMASAHDLFSQGAERASLGKLVEQVLPSLSVIKPAGVEVKHSVTVDARLNNSQAVSLAMVLHELCSNALHHGLNGEGTVEIVARPNERGVAIDVIDDGRGMPDDEATGVASRVVAVKTRRSGMGLKLVKELVSRELKGNFYVRPRPGGGTIATIEFPLTTVEKEGAAT